MAMLDLSSLLEHIPLEDVDLPIDPDFISSFLSPYFPEMPQSELAARIAEVIDAEKGKRP